MRQSVPCRRENNVEIQACLYTVLTFVARFYPRINRLGDIDNNKM